MDIKTITFPSVLESYNSDLKNVTSRKDEGMKIRHDDRDYLVGKLALAEGNSPHKAINSTPDEVDYRVLLKAALLKASEYAEGEVLNVTTGFPFSTYNMNEEDAVKYIRVLDSVVHDARTYGGEGYREVPVNIGNVHVMPELLGAITSVRNGSMQMRGGMFIVSLGYGTLEIGMSNDSGFIQRTFNSGNGLRYAVKSAMQKLQRKHYLGLRTEHQFDDAFHTGDITLNRKRTDLTDIRKEALQEYYADVISPLIRNTWTDEDFSRAGTLVLVGGGAHYSDLVNQFHDEFSGVLKIEIPENPMLMASQGYSIQAKNNSENGVAVGIDLGNAHTSVSILS